MKDLQVSNKDYAILTRVVNSSGLRDQSEVVRSLIQNYAHELIQPTQIIIDLQPAHNEAYKTQEQWILLYNAQQGEFRGKRMISAPDVIGASEHASPKALVNLRRDFKSRVVTSTHISYHPDTLAGVVTHNYQSTVVSPKVISLDEIPILRGESASKVVKTSKGCSYMRALADDKYAKPVTLLKRLSALSQKEPENIVLWTSDRFGTLHNGRTVWFNNSDSGFRVDSFDSFNYGSGHSRGVLVNPRSRRAKK